MPKPNKFARLSLVYIILTLGCESIGSSYNFAEAPYAPYTQCLTLLVFLPLGIKYVQKLLSS